jgi:prepilin-type N-terminal cleavage/methylation domain-containing protein
MERGRLRGSAFTLVELLVVIAIIVVLLGILATSLSAVFRSARNVADEQAARSMALAAEQFRADMSFGVPLAFDGDPLPVDGPAVLDLPGIVGTASGSAPVYRNDNVTPGVEFVAVYSRGEDLDFFRGGSDRVNTAGQPVGTSAVDPANPWDDSRYSKHSLAIYLAGSLGSSVDGIDAAGMNRPKADGSFFGVGSEAATSRDRFEAYLDPTSTSIRGVANYVERLEFGEHGRTAPWSDDAGLNTARTARRFSPALSDRYGRAYRYYRWESGRRASLAANPSERGVIATPADLNIPAVLADSVLVAKQAGLVGLDANDPSQPELVDVTAGNAKLRGATWAIVGAGPNGLFGNEEISEIADAFGESSAGMSALEQARLRERARADNIVEVGS